VTGQERQGCLLVAKADPGRSALEIAELLRKGYESLRSGAHAPQQEAENFFRGAASLTDTETPLAIETRLAQAYVFSQSGRCDAAVTLLNETVRMSRRGRHLWHRQAALAQLSQCLIALGQIDAAERVAKEILAYAPERFPLGKVEATATLGDVRYFRSQFSAAETLYREVLTSARKLGDTGAIAEATLNIGYALASQTLDDAAKTQFLDALDLARAEGDRRRQANALRALGNLQLRVSNHYEAIRYLELAEDLLKTIDDNASLATLYNALGEVHRRLNDLPTALQYFEKASSSALRVANLQVRGAALIEAGYCLRHLRRFDEAIHAYEEARKVFEATGFTAMEGGALAGLGNVYVELGQFEVAIQLLGNALQQKLDVGDVHQGAEILNDLADAYVASGRIHEAIDSSYRALEYSRKSDELVQEGRTFANLARISHMQGDLPASKRYLELAIAADEEKRVRIPSAELRTMSFEASRYSSYVALLLEMSTVLGDLRYQRLALEALERSRSRGLLDRLHTLPTVPVEPANSELIVREAFLRDRVRALALRADLGQASGQDPELSDLLGELRRVRGLLHAHEGPSSAGAEAIALSADEIVSRFTGTQSVLLEFFLDEPRSFLWVVGNDRFEVHELPSRRELQARIADSLALLTARQNRSPDTSSGALARLKHADRRFYEQSFLLSQELLGSVKDLDTFQRLVVVVDGALNYLPFSALPHPGRSGSDAASYVPLVATHEILRVPSVTALRAISSRMDRKPLEVHSKVALVGDPVFSATDNRVRVRERPAADSVTPTALEIALQDLNPSASSLARLLESREELLAIAALSPGEHVTVTDFAANRTRAEHLLRENYPVVHFATHGILNSAHPELSGLVLSLLDENGYPQDGFLRLQDIYRMRIETDLIVLSACETARGPILEGEGLSGLALAFLNAGAVTVVASHWKVDDLATRLLMEEFYRALFLGNDNPTAALRRAQVSLWRRARTRSPFFWSAFEVYGAP
jgi:CHAT domain-containing protein/tetratricopeptide (TPR) repeat protein